MANRYGNGLTTTGSLVVVKDIVKTFPGTVALNQVSFDIRPKEVHVLLGENGAGKSTLMKILSGIYSPTSGEIVLGETTYASLSPTISKTFGIAVIYQELSVIDHLSIEENLFVGNLPTVRRLGISVVDRRSMRAKARSTLARVGLRRAPETLVGDLSISEKQQVEIAKALARDARVLILDEPTSSLTEEEVSHLFKVIGELRNEGIGMVYISHKLKEIREIGDRVSVLKDGCLVGTFDAKTTPTSQLIASMVGRHVSQTRPSGDGISDDVVLDVRGLSSADGSVRDVTFSVRGGEIFGFAGLIGSGRSELMEVIFGARRRRSGTVSLRGQTLLASSPYQAVKSGIALLTEDRRRTGLFQNFTVAENISVLSFLRSSKRRLSLEPLDFRQERELATEYRKKLGIRCAGIEQNISELSGGNQQKTIISKWLAAHADMFIFDEPTRGIDVGAKSEIYDLMRALANQGKCILMVSSELPELLATCDRIAVYKDGTIVQTIDNANASEEQIMHLATA